MIAQSNAQKGGTEFTIKGGVTLPKYSYANAGSSEDRSVYQGFKGLSDIAPQTDLKIRNSIYAITLGLRLGGDKK